MELPNNVDEETLQKTPSFPDSPYDYFDSNCSTPYVSAPSSPSRNVPASASYFFSAPTSPIHFLATSAAAASFEFNGADSTESMIAADEIFLNGQIRPMKLSSHLKNPQHLVPLTDLNEEEEEEENETTAEVCSRGRDFRSGSVHRRARSLSPLRNSRFQWQDEEEEDKIAPIQKTDKQNDGDNTVTDSANSSASNSRSSSSSSRHSKRWIFLKDLLYRSKSEGREREKSTDKERFWHSISFSSASKDKSKESKESCRNSGNGNKKAAASNGVGKRRGPLPSAHERHYTANRAQAEEMRKRTFLPYRQGLIGCLGFNSKGYGAVSGFAKAMNPVSSR